MKEYIFLSKTHVETPLYGSRIDDLKEGVPSDSGAFLS